MRWSFKPGNMKTLTAVTLRNNTGLNHDVHELLFTKKLRESGWIRDREKQYTAERREAGKKTGKSNKPVIVC